MKTIYTLTPKEGLPHFFWHRLTKVWHTLLFAFLLAFTQQAAATIRYVKAGGTGGGTSWSDASGDLQAMINASSSGDQVWVAGGTYIPNRRADATATITTGDRNNAFVMKNGVKIYGGLAGTETALSQRNLSLTANASILSGDLSSNDNGYTNNSDNAYHVVVSAAGTDTTARLDGFTIQGGNCDGSTSITINGQGVGNNGGGGIRCDNSSPTLIYLTVKGNAGRYGAGICCSIASPYIDNSTVCGNASYYGGGFLCSTSQAALTNVLICGNTAVEQGGGMYNEFGTIAPILTNVTIAGNTANTSGGAMYNNLGASLQIHNSVIYGNNTGIVNNSGTPTIQYSLVQGLTDTTNSCISGNTDPLFVNPLSPGLNTGGNYSLQTCSPLVNKGSNDYYNPYLPAKPYNADGSKNMYDTLVKTTPYLADITTDLAGNARFYNSGTVDIGVYERYGSVAVVVGSAGIVYVKQDGSGTGASWDCATSDLQAAINAAAWGNKVWVASGIYKPASGQSFTMKDGVSIYGGFAGTETTVNARAATGRSTLTGNGAAVVTNNNKKLTAAAILDGFIITGGTNSGVFINNYSTAAFSNCNFFGNSAAFGGGMAVYDGRTITFSNCTFSNNSATGFGGGIYMEDASATFSNCIFGNNTGFYGGGLYASYTSHATLTNCTFNMNSAQTGAGINNSESIITLSHCSFTSNTASGSGGGIASYSGTSLVSNCSFSNNAATSGQGGGIDTYRSYIPITGCTFQYNQSRWGGGIACYKMILNNPVTNCRFSGNTATDGGAVYNTDDQGVIVVFTNCLFSGNYASDAGGAMYNDNCIVNVTNCTISGNYAYTHGGGIMNPTTSLRNSIVYNNKCAQESASNGIYTYSGVIASEYSLVQGFTSTANHNFSGNTDPLFVNPIAPGQSTGGDYHLQICSPVKYNGYNGYYASGQNPDLSAITLDLDSNNRFYNSSAVDLGAYEARIATTATASAAGIVYVKAGGTGSGESWSCPAGDLQAAINAASAGGQVWVTGGIFVPNRRADATGTVTAGDRNDAFVLKSGVKIYGSFTGTETTLAARNPYANTTLLSGDLNNDDLTTGSNSDNAYHVVISGGDVSTAVLDGFIIQGGNANGSTAITLSNGQTVGTNGGGGINCSNSSPTLNNLNITGNAGRYGAGLCQASSSSVITNSSIINNTGYYGGGVICSNSGASFTNVLISHNTAVEQGGAMYNEFAVAPVLTNVTITSNTANNGGGAMYNNLGPSLQLRNSIVYSNNTGIYNNNGTPVIQYSLVQGLTSTANGNISGAIDPLFQNPSDAGQPLVDGAYMLQPCSPAINAGNSAFYNSGQSPDLSAVTTDLFAFTRIQGKSVDMGAYETAGNPSPDYLANNGDVTVATISGSTNLIAAASLCRLVATLLPTGVGTALTGTVNGKVWIENTQPTSYVKRHYEITPATNAATATSRVTLYFAQSEFDDFNAQSVIKLPTSPTDAVHKFNVMIEERPGVSSDGSGLPATYSGSPITIDPAESDIVWNNTLSRWEVSFGVTGFGGFFVKVPAVDLPLTLVSFTGSQYNGYNKLQWVTADEVNTKNFVLERSSDGSSFNAIATIAANGAGNGNYGYKDYFSFSGKIYYRLKMVDTNGSYTYSTIVTLINNGSSAVSIYPNPATDVINIDAGMALLNTRAGLYDANGRLLQNILITAIPQTVNIQSLTNGLYLIQFANGSTIKFVKQ